MNQDEEAWILIDRERESIARGSRVSTIDYRNNYCKVYTYNYVIYFNIINWCYKCISICG